MRHLAIATVISVVLSSPSYALLLGDAEAGESTNEAKCVACHVNKFGDQDKVYTRKKRRVNSVEGLLGMVEMCNTQTKSDLSDDDIDDVVAFLNEHYYKFDTD